MSARGVASRRPSGWREFTVAASAGGSAVAIFLVEMHVRVGGDAVTVAVTDIGETMAALFAAAACAVAAHRAAGRLRAAWILIAASACSWGLGMIAWTVSEVWLQLSPTSPSLADVGYMAAFPFAAAGILTLPVASNSTDRWRAVLDGGIVAGSLIFVALALGLDTVYLKSPLGDMGRLITAAYPAFDVVLITLLVLVVRRSAGPLRISALLLLIAFSANLVADALYAYSFLGGTYGTLGNLLDTGWVIGYVVIALAAIWPVNAMSFRAQDTPVEPWQLALPWLGVVAIMAAAVVAAAQSHPLAPLITAVAIVVGLLFVTSQALLLIDSVRLIKTSRDAEAQARESTSLLNEVITKAPSGIARVGVDLRVVDANPRLYAMLRAEPASLVGSKVTDFIGPEDLAYLAKAAAHLTAGKVETIQGESAVHRLDQTVAWMLWTVTAVRKPSGAIDYFLAMFEDISARHEAEEAAKSNLAASERLNQLKSEFMSMVSHEFRTALTGIQGYSEMMNTQEVTPEEVKEFSGDIYSDALRLNRMITEMLDLDRIESGRITLQLTSVDINQVLRDQAERAQMTTTQHRISVDLAEPMPVIAGDTDRIVQVVANLLSNAVKYSPEGGEIVVSSRAADGCIKVSVRDHGQGIPAEFKDRIFGRYQRYEAAGTKQVVGTGLGLAIAQQIIQLHGGRIWVDSKVGDGSDFQFTLPIATPAAGAVAPAVPPVAAA